MRFAHVRERHAAAGTSWRLAAALPGDDPETGRWIDLEVARRRLARDDARLAHNDPVFRRAVTTLDDHLVAGGRVAHLAPLAEPWRDPGRIAALAADDDLLLRACDLRFGSPILAPPSLRDFYAFEGHVAVTWQRRNLPIPEAWYRIPVFYFSNVSEIRGPDDPVWAARGSTELDFELEVAAIVDTPARELSAANAEDAIGGYTIFNDWSARDLQREETAVRLGPAKGKDFASTLGPWLVTPDELADARPRDGKAPDLAMTAEVNGREISRGRWSDVHYAFGEMLERASADVRLRPGDVIGSGTVGTGCLLEVREATLGRYLEPGDEVVLRIERLGTLRAPVVASPPSRGSGAT